MKEIDENVFVIQNHVLYLLRQQYHNMYASGYKNTLFLTAKQLKF